MTDLDIGLVGVGSWGRLILRDLMTAGCRVHVVARSAESSALAEQSGAASVVGAVDDLPTIDGAVVATPTTVHHQTTLSLMDRQIPIFVEKPLTDSLDKAEDLCRRASDRIFVMDKWRYHRGVQALAEIAGTGELGAVTSLRCVRRGWRSKPPDTDVLWYLGPHDLSITLEVLGGLPEPTSISIDWHGDEMVGAVAVLGDDPQVVIDLSERSVDRTRRVELSCVGGIAVLRDSYASEIEIYRHGPTLPLSVPAAERRPIPTDMPLLAELEAFLEHVQGGPPPKSSCADAVQIVSTLARLHDLAAGRQR